MRFWLCKMTTNNIRTTDNQWPFILRWRVEAKIVYLKINKNLSTTTFIRLIVRVIVKSLYIVFFSPVNFRIFLACFCLLSFSFYYFFLPYYIQPIYQQLIMVIKFPCKICNKAVASNHHAVRCDKSHLWVHIKCNKINLQTYIFLQKSPSAWYCIKCFEDIVPFGTISNEKLFKRNQGSKIKFTVLTKHHTPPSQDLIDQLNESMDYSPSEKVSSKYYEPCEVSSLLNNSKICLSFYHLNISSPSFHIEELTTLISEHNLTFDFFWISETKWDWTKLLSTLL